MKELKIIVRKADPAENDTTIKIPLPSLKFVNSLIPEWVNHKLVEKELVFKNLSMIFLPRKLAGRLPSSSIMMKP